MKIPKRIVTQNPKPKKKMNHIQNRQRELKLATAKLKQSIEAKYMR